MSLVDFNKCPCPLSLFPQFSRQFKNGPMSHVDFKVYHVMSFTFFLLTLGSTLHVDFKKCPGCCFRFRGHEPLGR